MVSELAMLHFTLQNIPFLNQLIAWWEQLTAISGLSHIQMVIITCVFISVMIFLTGAVASLFLQSVLAIFRRKSSNNPFDDDEDDEV